ncbi:hypothetical protein XI06_12645 [Bradyrhizobium sp. CCBAU 11434]|uniref:hypothetical protein n=1 Tax=Bradyrhizobium sp. CCBAU 11434 TaxID=1630885 RepID=UPI002304F355|nr:hypothetical protein [Bradyrhizobium sp. CCBAU 11434]MDA9521206.1 hypothetical protein [Bradyrhizobium sp. CCBAU 11434]
MLDQNNDYSSAGPGYKRRMRRERLRKESTVGETGSTRKKSKHRPKPYSAKPAKEEHLKRNITPRGLKERIRRLVLIYPDQSALDICETLHNHGWPGSGVLVGGVRQEMREIVKMLDQYELINRDALKAFRRAYQDEAKIRWDR